MTTEAVSEERRSCVGCPSFVPDGPDSERLFGIRTGMDHCARFGYILGRDEMHPRQADGLRKATAKKCHEYGLPRPTTVTWAKVNPPVTLPSREAVAAQVMLGEDDENESIPPVTSCTECIFFNKAETVRLGWRGTGICASRNELVFGRQVEEKSQRCGSSVRHMRYGGTPVHNRQMDGQMRLIPELVDAYFKMMTPLERWKSERVNFVDPSEYPTDRALTVEDKARGIRAWREIVDHDTGVSVFIPVYDKTQFPKNLQALVPTTGDDEHPENFIDYLGLVFMLAALWWEMDETPALWGPAGVGKTEVLRHMAWLMQLPFHRLSITASTEVEELVGQFTLQNNETKFVHGRLPRAWQSPGVICLDEPNVGPVEVWQAVRPLTDNSKQFVIDKNAGEIIERHPDSVFALAMNPAWDTRNVGADMIADADSSRLAHLSVEYPPFDIEREILREWADDPDIGWKIGEDTLDQIVGIAEDLRGLAGNHSITTSWGVRHSIKVAKLSRIWPLTKAYDIALVNFLDPRERELVRGTVKTRVG
jgi:MoxR-like ATPase